MTIDLKTPVGDIALALPQSRRYLEGLGVDYCCGGHRSLEEACEAVQRSPQEALAGLLNLEQTPSEAEPTQTWSQGSLTDLMAHIEATHHAYLKTELPRLDSLLTKVLKAHGERHPELDQVFDLLQDLTQDLMPHMMKEEQILYPFIRQMETGQPASACFPSVQSPIRVMESEHVAVGALLAQLRACTQGYAVPADGCMTFRAFYEGLDALEKDTHLHILLENQILHPRAVAMEAAAHA